MKPDMSASPSRAAVYARQSLSLTDGIDRQVSLCKKLCEAKEWQVVEVFEDNDVSASKLRGKDTAWAKMLEGISKGRFDVVVAVDLDRLLRRVSDLSLLTETGVKVLTVNGEIDLTTADGEFRATMLASIAQFETRRKSERQLRANAAKSAAGKPVPTRRRYGYETDGCTPRPDEAKEVKRLFEEFRKGASIRSLALEMRSRKVDPGGGKGWPVNRIRSILGNPFYGGQVYHAGVVTDSDVVTPVVPKEVAIEVRAILADPSRKTSPGSAVRHELTGLATCGVCGAFLHYMNDYMCSKALNHVSIQKKKLEPYVMWLVYNWASSDAEAHATKSDSKEIEEKLIASARIAEQIIDAQNMVLWPGADKSALKKTIESLGKEREILELEIESERSKNAMQDVVRQVRAAWLKPIDGDTYAAWKLAMQASAEAMGWWIDTDLLTTEAFETKTRIERQVAAWPEFWAKLPLDTRREVIRSLFKIRVNKGRTLDRIEVEVLYKAM